MHENPTRELPPEMIERDVLYMLTGDAPIWSVADLGVALDDRVAAIDAVGGLRRSGLLHQTTDGHVFATHAGVRAVEMIGRVA
jgi:hypothetical protein